VKRSILVLTAGCLTALVLGLALAYPLLNSEMPTIEKLPLDVDVVYLYMGSPNLDPNVTGLWRNYTAVKEVVETNGVGIVYDTNMLSYLAVLKVTNPSSSRAYLTDFELRVAPLVLRPNTTLRPDYSNGLNSPIIVDSRIRVDTMGIFDAWMNPGESRLVCLRGFVGVHDFLYEKLNNTPIYVTANAHGQATGDRVAHSGSIIKPVDFEVSGGNYLYNNLLNDNQMLLINHGLEVYVGTRR
jgi:hypothetical protein